MAVTEYYVDFAAGNDFSGTSFTDGAFTHATLTLTKTGAFTNASPGHWYYLDDNGSGKINTGYYKVASKTDNDNVVLATDPSVGDQDASDVVCTQATGTALLPWRSVHGALDLITRNSTDGDRINVKTGTAQTLEATLTYDEYGTPTAAAPLLIQGYTASAEDGGIGEIDGDATYGVCSAWTCVWFTDLKLGNCGSNDVLDLGTDSNVINCEIHTSSGFGVDLGSDSVVLGCWFHDLTGSQAVDHAQDARVLYSFFDVAVTSSVIDSAVGAVVIGNIIDLSGADTSVYGIRCNSSYMTVIHNTVCCSQDNTSVAISAAGTNNVVMNNVVEGWDGAGGIGIELTNNMRGIIGANAVCNCTTPYSLSASKGNHAIAPNDTLGATPFTDAANDDFSIKDSQTGVTEDAFPSTFRGL